jgi:hypothetical protein
MPGYGEKGTCCGLRMSLGCQAGCHSGTRYGALRKPQGLNVPHTRVRHQAAFSSGIEGSDNGTPTLLSSALDSIVRSFRHAARSLASCFSSGV